MVGGIGEAVAVHARHEAHHFVLLFEHVAGRVRAAPGLPGDHLAVQHLVQQAVGFGAVVVDSGAVAPPVGGEVERHGVVLLAVGRGGLVIDGAVGLHGPGEITAGGVARLVAIHIGLGPIPDGVEFLFFVHLDGDHHAVGHALAAHIMMGDVGYVGKLAVGVFAALIVDGFGV